ncbi:hypothetical protein PMW_70 [Pseudomonas phage phiPMW]|uniref:Uncharacterized protein n=1 Tax=Pseudomonas phage phiPMW TaxID=1815582 RepID=A0A1S5R1A6_9CAUD|nr:hypothetical protein FDG97_gp070 [Pseudomonas phage phiPMW]ANA49195.1 hypothetical protein PMW_70 [Pseudomonas phage phiPMW]
MKYLNTYIKKEVWTENGENKVRYHAVVSGMNWQGIFWRAKIGTVLVDLIPNLYWMEDEEFNALVGNAESGSLERAQNLINLYRSEVDKWNERRAIEKEAKKKLTFYIKYPDE